MKSEIKNLRTKILIVEDDMSIRRQILNFFNLDDDIEVCAFFSSGCDILAGIKFYNPDVIITDFTATDFMGLKIIDRINISIKNDRPYIIVTSSLNDTKILERSFSYGADYLIYKPIILSLLKDVILLMTDKKSNFSDNMIETAQIKNLVKLMGVPINILGYIYIVEALKHMITFEKDTFLNDIYEAISLRYNTSIECVEVAIRNAIKKATKINNKIFNKMFELYDKHPSNSIFLMSLKEELLDEYLKNKYT